MWDEELCGPVEYSSPSTLSENESSAIVLDDDDYQTPAINSGCGVRGAPVQLCHVSDHCAV